MFRRQPDEHEKKTYKPSTEDTETIEKMLRVLMKRQSSLANIIMLLSMNTVDKCAANLNDIIQNEKKKLIHNNDDLDVIINDYKRFERRQ